MKQNRILTRLASQEYDMVRLDSMLNSLETIELNEIAKTSLFNQIQNSLKQLNTYMAKDEFMSIAIPTFNKITYLKMQIDKLHSIINKVIHS